VDLTVHAQQQALFHQLGVASAATADDYLAAARRMLAHFVANEGLVDRTALARKPGGYTRNLLCGGSGLSVWAMVWSPGAVTCIHDHHCSCCFAVIQGAVDEIRYRPIDDSRAVPVSHDRRGFGFVACMMPSGPNVHQMRNTGTEEAISVHIYGYDHAVRTSSVHREYAAAQG
jgi:predicted metal-dependent enzyme (double-stranded beta helix superfamily)